MRTEEKQKELKKLRELFESLSPKERLRLLRDFERKHPGVFSERDRKSEN